MFLTIGEAVSNGFMICGFMINLMAGRSILSTYAQLIKKNAVLNAFNTVQVGFIADISITECIL